MTDDIGDEKTEIVVKYFLTLLNAIDTKTQLFVWCQIAQHPSFSLFVKEIGQ